MAAATQMTDTQLTARRTQAENRLYRLGIDTALVEDQSGQTSAEEHLIWLTTATDTEIIEWSQYFA